MKIREVFWLRTFLKIENKNQLDEIIKYDVTITINNTASTIKIIDETLNERLNKDIAQDIVTEQHIIVIMPSIKSELSCITCIISSISVILFL